LKNQIESRIEDAIIVFGRFLRQAGCQIGSGEIMLAISASSYIEIANREDFRQTLKSCFITNHKQLILFDQLFDIFWRNPDKIEKVSNILKRLHESRFSQEMAKSMRETIEDMYQKREDGVSKKNEKESNEEKSFNIFLYSPNELLKRKRFDSFTNEELEEAKKFINNREWIIPKRKLRRLKPGKVTKKLDIRNTIRNNIFPSQDFIKLCWKQPKYKERPLVVLMDISGSMDHYTRILMHFIHTIYSSGNKVEAFTFGTRLTRVTQHLRQKDINDSIEMINNLVKDWSGGTKIGETIQEFNLRWARRVLGNGAIVILITDGWDTGNTTILNQEFNRLSKSCHRIIWLNPNLGYQDFKPLTLGVQVILKHVDDFLPIHNLNCLTDLNDLLSSLNNGKGFIAQA